MTLGAGQEGGVSCFHSRRVIGLDHPAFAGHFPGNPVLPGVVLLAEVLEAIRAEPQLSAAVGTQPLLMAAKFLAPVGPGSELAIDLEWSGSALAFAVAVTGTWVAKGRYQALSR